MYLHTSSLELTFAGLRALDPRVVNVSIASTSAILIPSTTGSAATVSTGFLERAALWAHARARTCWRPGRRADDHVRY